MLLCLRLVWYDINLLSLFIPDEVFFKQCDSFLRLAKESIVHEQVEESTDLEALIAEVDDDKCFAAMSIAKTISTVRYRQLLVLMEAFLHVLDFTLQIVSSIDSSPEILAQVQEIIIPIIVFSLENRLLGTRSFYFLQLVLANIYMRDV